MRRVTGFRPNLPKWPECALGRQYESTGVYVKSGNSPHQPGYSIAQPATLAVLPPEAKSTASGPEAAFNSPLVALIMIPFSRLGVETCAKTGFFYP